MATLTDAQIASYAAGAGFKGTAQQIAIAVALAESGGNPNATNQNKAGALVVSIDRGLWQINNVYHNEVSDQCAFSPPCAAGSAYRISNGGSNWTPWTTYNTGAYQRYMSRAQAAIGGGSDAGNPSRTGSTSGATASGTPLTVPSATNQFGLLPGTTNTVPTTQTLGYSGKNLKADIFGPLNTIIALGLLLIVLFGIGRTRWGYVAMYYGEGLILLFLFATQAQYIKQHLSVLTGLGSQNETSYVTKLSVVSSASGTPQQTGNVEFSQPSPVAPSAPPPVVQNL